jgi:hypothetical protein
MDHLVSFRNSTPIEVPYVCHSMFEGSWHDYPERRGWDRKMLLQGNFEGKTLAETRSFLQEWMYFGLLFHIFDQPGMSFNPQDFLRQTSHGLIITTQKLPEYAEKWYFRPRFGLHGGRSIAQKQETFNHAYTCLKELHRFVSRFCGKDSNSGRFAPPATFWPLTPEISLSIIALADSITKLGFESTGISFNLDWGISSLLYDRMVASRWCRNVVKALTTTQQVHLLYSAETLAPPDLPMNHVCGEGLFCTADQVENDSYETQHTQIECRCGFEGPSVEAIVAILESGDIPVIKCEDQVNGLDIRVVPQKSVSLGSNYVAISHICEQRSHALSLLWLLLTILKGLMGLEIQGKIHYQFVNSVVFSNL